MATAEAASALFQVLAQAYAKTSIVLTNCGVGSWGEILCDTTAAAMLDRLLHPPAVASKTGPGPPRPIAAIGPDEQDKFVES